MQGDLVGDHERRVEADAELADQALRRLRVLGLLDLGQQAGGAGLGDGADQVDDVLAAHADAVVPHRQGPGRLVDLQRDVQVGGVGFEVGVGEGFQAELVEGV